MLNPNQDMKSRILSFKEETVKEILSVVPRLANNQALQLLQRGALVLKPAQSNRRLVPSKLSGVPTCLVIGGQAER